MLETEHGSGTQTVGPDPVAREFSELTAPTAPPTRGRGSRKVRALVAGGVGLAAGAGAAVVLLLGSSSPPPPPPPPPLPTAPQIAAMDKSSTLSVVAYADPGSPLVQSGGSTILDSGSAWVYDAAQGLIVTNAHVVAEAKTVKAGFNQASLSDATIVGVDLRHDIAVLRVASGQLAGLRTLKRANPSGVQQGEQAYALGFQGDGNSNFLNPPYQLSTGSVEAVSGVSVTVDADPLGPNANAGLFQSGLIETDAAINPGNSGGPLVNDKGQLIGMNTAAAASAHTLGYAISIGTLDSIVPELAQGKSNDWAGFGVIAIPPDLASKWNLSGGLIVTSVTADTPADQAGMTKALSDATNAGDWIVIDQINGQNVTTEQEYVNDLSQLQSGESFTVDLGEVDNQGNVVSGTVGTYTLTAP